MLPSRPMDESSLSSPRPAGSYQSLTSDNGLVDSIDAKNLLVIRTGRTRMSIDSSSPTRRKFLANSALATSAALLASGGVFNFLAPNQAAASNGSIRPFRVDIPEEALVDLRRRILDRKGGV